MKITKERNTPIHRTHIFFLVNSILQIVVAQKEIFSGTTFPRLRTQRHTRKYLLEILFHIFLIVLSAFNLNSLQLLFAFL